LSSDVSRLYRRDHALVLLVPDKPLQSVLFGELNKSGKQHPNFTMAVPPGPREARPEDRLQAGHPVASVRERNDSFRRAAARWLGGRVKPGHGEGEAAILRQAQDEERRRFASARMA
jgi:hypothetical protein